jgi:hypothetical protein
MHTAVPFSCIASPSPLPRERSARRLAPAPGTCRRADALAKLAPHATHPRPYPSLSCRCTSAPAATSAFAVSVCPFEDAFCSAVPLHRQPTAIAARAIWPRPCPQDLSSSRRARQDSPTCDTPLNRTHCCLAGARPRPPPPAPSPSPCAHSTTQGEAPFACTASPQPSPRERSGLAPALRTCRRADAPEASPTCDIPPTVPIVVLPVHVRARHHQRLRHLRVPILRRIVQRRFPAPPAHAHCCASDLPDASPLPPGPVVEQTRPKLARHATHPRPYPSLSCRCTSAPAATSAFAVSVCPLNDVR